MTSQVAGVVLAAGRSTRMGRPKALLRVGGKSFIAAAVDALRSGGCAIVVAVVGGAGADGWDAFPWGDQAREAAEEAGAIVVVNAMGESQQIQSFRLGLALMAPSITAALALPVDHPLVRSSTVRALLEAHEADNAAILRPTHDGRPGHPTLFPRWTWELLGDPTLPAGARSLVESSRTHTVDVPVEDLGVLADIDTPEAYDEWVEGR